MLFKRRRRRKNYLKAWFVFVNFLLGRPVTNGDDGTAGGQLLQVILLLTPFLVILVMLYFIFSFTSILWLLKQFIFIRNLCVSYLLSSFLFYRKNAIVCLFLFVFYFPFFLIYFSL